MKIRVFLPLLVLIATLISGQALAKKKRKKKAVAPVATSWETADGIQVVHIPTDDTQNVSMRFIVGAGGVDDPKGREGLAHLLEHLIFHGTYRVPEGELFRQVHAKGGQINAYTMSNSTMYVLDTSKESFEELAMLYLKHVTNPALNFAKVQREGQVVLAEENDRDIRSLMWLVDGLLFLGEQSGRRVIGTKKSRERIQMMDIQQFYSKHYRAANSTAVFIGPITKAKINALLEGYVLWPPEDKSERKEAVTREPSVPLDIKARSWVTATVAGFHLDDASYDTCLDLAEILQSRMYKKLVAFNPTATEVAAFCWRSRGEMFVLGLATTPDLSGSRFPDVIQAILKSVAKSGITKSEKRALQKRNRADLKRLRSDSAILGEHFGFLMADTTADFEVSKKLLEPRQFNAKKMNAALRKSLNDKHKVMIHISPFEG